MTGKLDVHLLRMFDCYGGLLTDRQRDVMELYYNEDCSLSEIAELHGVSRQAVSDSLRHSRQILLETEQKLGLAEQTGALRLRFEQILAAAQQQDTERIAQLAEDALELIDS